jgi:hypothetical protein
MFSIGVVSAWTQTAKLDQTESAQLDRTRATSI